MLGIVFFYTVVTTALPAQQAAQTTAGGYSIKTNVRRVVVDVVVTKSKGEPVRGLTQKDFLLSEDGQPQTALSFESHDPLNRDKSAQVLPAHLPANTFINLPAEPEVGPLYVLLYDLANTDMDAQMFARQELVKFIHSKPEGTRFAILALSDGMHLMQGFTTDKKQLFAALDPNGKTPHMPMIFIYGGNYHAGSVDYYLAVMKEITRFLGGLPGRKNVIWVSSSFPFLLFPPGAPDVIEDFRKELTAMADQQIALYPVDSNGVGVNIRTIPTLDEVAWETGGRAYYNTNDLLGALNQATEDGALYYTLSYSSTNQNYDGKLRRIQVKLTQAGYRLSYRRQYFADTGAAAQPAPSDSTVKLKQATVPANAPPDTLDVYMRHGMPVSHDVLFSAHPEVTGQQRLATPEQMAALAQEPAYFRKRHKDRVEKALPPVPVRSYAITYAVPSRQFHFQGGNGESSPSTLEFAAAVYDSNGYMLNGSIVHATAAPDGKSKYFQAQMPFDVPENAAWMCLAVRDVTTGRIGNMEFSLPLASEPNAAPGANH